MRPLLFLLPVYIGSLKYYEKIKAALDEHYDVRFLIVKGGGERRRQMIDYCREKRYRFHVIDAGLERGGVRVPFFSPLSKRARHIRACRDFLEKYKPSKIVAVKVVPPHHIVTKEANRLGIDVIVLQWAFAGRTVTDPVRPSLTSRMYHRILRFLEAAVDWWFGGFSYIGNRGFADEVGVIDTVSANIYTEMHGFKREKIRAVGYADYGHTYAVQQKIQSDESFRDSLIKKYAINTQKRNILVVSRWFYRFPKDAMTIKEQVAYFERVIRSIRSVFPEDEADILFKKHPTEKDLYNSYKKYGVKIYGDEATMDELVCLSDLYIADPRTSANYCALASGVPAIFVNFSRYKSLNEGMKHYNIHRTIEDEETFVRLLEQARTQNLPAQYDNGHVDVESIQKIVSLVNGDIAYMPSGT